MKKEGINIFHQYTPVVYVYNYKNKIRIGNILKSIDVRTLASSRYSKNSSHAHPLALPHI